MESFGELYDRVVSETIQAFLTMSRREQELVIESVASSEAGFLQGVARSYAEVAVRDADTRRLEHGLLLLVIENQAEDYRDSLMMLALLDHSARKLGVKLEDLYEKCRNLATKECRGRFDSYFYCGNRTLSAFGFSEGADSEGRFLYLQD